MGDKIRKGTDRESAQPTAHSAGKVPGKTTLVAKRYGPPRGRKPAPAENAQMTVEASESPGASVPLASWEGKTFYHVAPDEKPQAHFTGEKERDQWQWSDPAAATLKVNSDAEGKSGQSLSEWAPAQARYMEADIEPLAGSGGKPEEVLHGHGPIELDPERITLQEAERLAAELDPSTRAGLLPFMESAATGATGSTAEGTDKAAGSGTADRGDGKGNASRAGKRKALTDEHGSEQPSWYSIAGAEVAREGGRTPTEHGQHGGSAGGQKDGTGKILGSGLFNVVDAPEDVAPLVNAGIVLVEANIAGFGRGLFERALKGMAREAIEREIAREAKTVIARSLGEQAERLRKLETFRKLPRAEQERILKDVERDIEREYYERLEKFARREAEEQQAIVVRLTDADDARSAHHRQIAAENGAAYREIEEAAASKAGGVLPRSGPIPRSLGAMSRAEQLARKLKLNINSPTTRRMLNSLDDKVSTFIGKFRKGSIQQKLPSEVLDMTVEEALKHSTTARKLLTDGRFAK
jgi:hypothetical protein